jgi:hypothetical protein
LLQDTIDNAEANTQSFDKDEELIIEAILNGRKVQEFLWQELSLSEADDFDQTRWVDVFQKRVNKILFIDMSNPNALVELRKRCLQQAALSICAMKLIDKIKEQ